MDHLKTWTCIWSLLLLVTNTSRLKETKLGTEWDSEWLLDEQATAVAVEMTPPRQAMSSEFAVDQPAESPSEEVTDDLWPAEQETKGLKEVNKLKARSMKSVCVWWSSGRSSREEEAARKTRAAAGLRRPRDPDLRWSHAGADWKPADGDAGAGG